MEHTAIPDIQGFDNAINECISKLNSIRQRINYLTILAGEDMGDDAFDALIARIEDAYDDLEIDAHRGDQPLYPVVMSVE